MQPYKQIRNNFKFKVSIVSIGLLILTLSGCSTRIGDFTVLSTKNVDLSRLGDYDVVPSRAKGEDLKTFSVPSMEEAVDKAIESVDGGVGMTDVTVEIVQGFFRAGYRIEGNVIVDPNRKTGKQ